MKTAFHDAQQNKVEKLHKNERLFDKNSNTQIFVNEYHMYFINFLLDVCWINWDEWAVFKQTISILFYLSSTAQVPFNLLLFYVFWKHIIPQKVLSNRVKSDHRIINFVYNIHLLIIRYHPFPDKRRLFSSKMSEDCNINYWCWLTSSYSKLNNNR